jgi:hypothetical protein
VGAAADLYGTVSWSPDGQSLAYPQIVARHADIAIWTIGRQPELHQGPIAVNSALPSCLWAPTGRAVLCVDTRDGEKSPTWLVVRRQRFHVATHRGPFLPLAWLPVQPPNSITR